MPRLQYVASLCATPPSGGVRFVFSLYPRVWGFESSLSSPTQVVRVAHSTPWLLYTASPCGEALKFRSLRSPANFQFEELMHFCGLIMPTRIVMYEGGIGGGEAGIFRKVLNIANRSLFLLCCGHADAAEQKFRPEGSR